MHAKRASTILYSFLVCNPIEKNHYFLLPSNICLEVIYVFISAKVHFKFIDLNSELTDIDYSDIQLNDSELAGILYTHLYGNEFTPNIFFDKLKRNKPNILIIDDRCLCFPDINFIPSKNVDLTIFSTGDKKQVNLGYGGFGISNNSDFHVDFKSHRVDNNLLNHIKKDISSFGCIDSNYILENSWLDRNKPTETLKEYFDKIQKSSKKSLLHKSHINTYYSININPLLQYDSSFQNWRFNIKCENKEAVLKEIFNQKLFASNHYFPVNKYYNVNCPNSVIIYNRTINLFQDSYFTYENAETVVDIINNNAIPIELLNFQSL